jgi:hypothetical protein
VLHRRTQKAGSLRADVSPADVLLILEMITFVDLPGPDLGRELRKKPPNSGRFFPNAGGQTAKKTVS